jgi:hypothetical protein
MSFTSVAGGVCSASTANALGIASSGLAASRYQHRRPEQTLLHRIVEQHYPAFTEQLAVRDPALPGYAQREFEDYLKCGRFEYGFLRLRCDSCHAEHLVDILMFSNYLC